jgi:hypothetical protein
MKRNRKEIQWNLSNSSHQRRTPVLISSSTTFVGETRFRRLVHNFYHLEIDPSETVPTNTSDGNTAYFGQTGRLVEEDSPGSEGLMPFLSCERKLHADKTGEDQPT